MPFPVVRCQARVWIATIIGGVLLALGSDSGARAVQGVPPAATAPLTTTLPLDAAVTQGRLDNGLRYILRANKQPLGRAELRLVVNAGSVLEADDQRGLAHFVEHMAFNGTRNFPKQEAIAFLQSLGMRAGPSINATTSYDETVYALQIPTDAPAVMDRALLILADWAHAITFDPAEVDKERGVIIEEWRLRRNATARMLDLQFPVLLKGSRYADRRPIGTVESLKTFPHARLKDFYTTWYRPDLMAVIGVGDFDPRVMQDLIRKRLGVIPAVKTPLSRPSYVVPAQIGTQYSAATDKEATGATVTVYAKRPVPAQLTVGDYRAEIVARLAAAMVSHRLTGVAQQPNSPLLSANATQGRVVRSGQAAIVNAGLRENLIERGLVALFGELERIARDGLTPEELERQKTIMLRGFELAVAQREARSSAQLAAEYVRLFTIDEPSPGLAYESDLIQRFVPQMTLAEVNAAARAWTVADNRVVLVNAPEKAGVVIPDAGRFAGMLKALGSASLPAYVARANNQPLIDAPPPAGTIVKTTTNAALGITEWELSNGLKVVIRPTTFKEDEVLFGAVSPGGTSLAQDADIVPAQTAVQVVTSLGVGRFASGDLRQALTGKVATVRPVISTYGEGLTGGGSRKDLETIFQLIYLTVTQPRRDPIIFNSLRSSLRSALANQAATPDFAFASALTAALSQDHPRVRPVTPQTVEAMNMDRSIAFYKDRFADASDFTFIFTGSVDAGALKPLTEQYLASLPSIRRRESWKDVGIRPPAGVVERRVEKGTEQKSRAVLVFTGPMRYDTTQAATLRAMTEVLQIRLRYALREDLAGTYVVTATSGVARRPREEYTVTVGFGAAPARVEALSSRVFAEIARFKAEGPTPQELANVKVALQREYETNSRQNGFVLTQLMQTYENGDPPDTPAKLTEIYRQLTAQTIRDAARATLDPARYVKVTLYPEKSVAR